VQATRERIITIIKKRGQATVQGLSDELGLTTVTIRHHLGMLRKDGLVAAPSVLHRQAPGRPQHIYSLTEEAGEHFPKGYEHLIHWLLEELHERFSSEDVQEVMQSIGERLAAQVDSQTEGELADRLPHIVEYLNEHGYMARWNQTSEGDYLLHVANCPYEKAARQHREICLIDHTLLLHLLRSSFERSTSMIEGDDQCTYIIHASA
jgi:predicted ArsR family transcriptional regulator